MTKPLLVLVLALGLSGCASLTTQIHDRYHDAEGHVNVHVVLQDVSWGIEADCAFGQTALARNICLYGRAVIDAALMVPPGPAQQPSVDMMLQTVARDHVELEPYFDFAMKVLEGVAGK